jgi:hypothetical protein
MRLLVLASVAVAVAAPHADAASKPLEMRKLDASVVRVGTLHGQPLYGLRLRSYLCSRSSAEADRIVPTSFRVAHYITRGRTTSGWGTPFRVAENDLYWVVSLGETQRACGWVTFEDVIPAENYGGLESSLGRLGYGRYRCYGVRLTVRAVLSSVDQRSSTPIAATRRAIVQCGRFHPGR